MKIRSKLILQFIFISATIVFTAFVFIYRQFQIHIEDEFYTLLESKSRMTAEMVLRHDEELKPIQSNLSEKENQLLPSVGNTSIYNDQFSRVFTLNLTSPQTGYQYLHQIQKLGSLKFIEHGFKALGISTQSHSGKKYLIITEDTPDFSKLSKLRNILIISFLLVMIAIALGGWFFAGQSLRPVEKIVKEVENILPSNLSKRVIFHNQKDELAHLVSTFNKLLDRIEHAFHMQRSFVSNVSHELKNPLAAMDAQIQVAKTKLRNPEEDNLVLDSLQEDVEEITTTIDKLLQLAKFYSDITEIPFSKIRLDELIYQAKDQLQKTKPEYIIKFEILNLPETEERLCISGNEVLLKTAFYNLIENGGKFSTDQLVKITLDFNSSQQAIFKIQNKSIPITDTELNRIFDPFFRSIQHNTIKGSGLGLSIVKSILDIHNLTVDARYDEISGMAFSILFPAHIENEKL